MSYIILKCGSAARGDTNKHSDIDFVCLYDGTDCPVIELKGKYPGISFFSLDSVNLMKGKGALFLVHLDVEGKVVEGERSILSSIAGYRPTSDELARSVERTSKFIQHIAWYPASAAGRLWLCNALFTSLRNVIYCRNAMRSIYTFGLGEAIAAFGLNPQDEKLVYQVRIGKYAFRSEGTIPDVEAELDNDALSALATKISCKPTAFLAGGCTDWDRGWNFDYWDERFIERAIINGEIPDDGFQGLILDHNYNRRALPNAMRKIVARYAQATD